jgi:basic membrane protein A
MKKLGISFLIISLVLLLGVGCTNNQESQISSEDETVEVAEKTLKVGMILPGPVNDGGWSATAYDGLLRIEEEYGAEVSYNENTASSDYDEVFRLFATQGYDIIFAHGGQFADAALKIAKDFPEVQFCVTSTKMVAPPNVSSLYNDTAQQGFLEGVVAATVSKSNLVGIIGGMDIPSIADSVVGFEAGAKYVNPDIEVLTTYTGNFDDAVQAKEIALSMIARGADVVMQNAGPAGNGAIEACSEEGVYALGSVYDQSDLAPDAVLTSGIADMPKAFLVFVDKYLAGDFEAISLSSGIKEGTVYLAPYHDFEDVLTEEQKDIINDVFEELKSGEIDVRDYADFQM